MIYRYLDEVHVDVGFGDTMAMGGAHYDLVFVNCTIQYNWVFPLKTYPLMPLLTLSMYSPQRLMALPKSSALIVIRNSLGEPSSCTSPRKVPTY